MRMLKYTRTGTRLANSKYVFTVAGLSVVAADAIHRARGYQTVRLSRSHTIGRVRVFNAHTAAADDTHSQQTLGRRLPCEIAIAFRPPVQAAYPHS